MISSTGRILRANPWRRNQLYQNVKANFDDARRSIHGLPRSKLLWVYAIRRAHRHDKFNRYIMNAKETVVKIHTLNSCGNEQGSIMNSCEDSGCIATVDS
jgi:hypothetical protein